MSTFNAVLEFILHVTLWLTGFLCLASVVLFLLSSIFLPVVGLTWICKWASEGASGRMLKVVLGSLFTVVHDHKEYHRKKREDKIARLRKQAEAKRWAQSTTPIPIGRNDVGFSQRRN